MKVLIVEDDREAAVYIIKGLNWHGYVAELACNGREGYVLATTGSYEVAIIDRMLPEMDGLSLVRQLREAGIRTSVLFLTNLGGIDDRVEGLNAGGDDYLVKPFALTELLARVNALARRHAMAAADTILRCADLEMDLVKRRVSRAGREITLQAREFQLLEVLMQNAGRAVTRTMLLESVWNFHFDPKTNIVETHISRLRSKVDRGFDQELIGTVRGIGYTLRAEG